MREFTADYLTRTREGMWDDSHDALEPLALDERERVLDVGCGTGELTRVLDARCPGDVVGCDADRRLLAAARERNRERRREPDLESEGDDEGENGDESENEHSDPVDRNERDHGPVVAGDALRLPFPDDTFDLVVCQALLINLPDPAAAVREFARVSSNLVAAIEPDNGSVTVDSSVDAEPPLERRARRAYLEGIETDVTLGASAREVFAEVGVEVLETRRYDHDRTIEPPYDEGALTVAKRKASGSGLADDRATMLAGELTEEGYDRLRTEWRSMGRDVIEQMGDREYRRREVVPFYVTVGAV
ncbi:class I SAM-dependent methyltransferase [Natronoglomus mannanivorans]|uniref:Class I SAM-dependent methyltransferase n=1 Tax=Natronoglomus mannanivorans TaxID=2979990 RepID=A0AAP2Z1I0_9EURY|nr:class I SAM-dependent methyltransferase [Halobacteria archaeon AArc-xg1-1]